MDFKYQMSIAVRFGRPVLMGETKRYHAVF